MKFTMYHLESSLQKSLIAHMGVKISFADFLSIYENLTFKSITNERIRWFFILSFGPIWRCFETTRRCLFVPFFSLQQQKNMVTHIDRKAQNLNFLLCTMDSARNSYGTFVAEKNNKKDAGPLFFHNKTKFKITSLVRF